MAVAGIKMHTDEWVSKTVTAPSGGYLAGLMLKINDIVGVIIGREEGAIKNEAGTVLQVGGKVIEGDTTAFVYRCSSITVPCAIATTGTYTAGSKVYFDAADAEVNQSPSGNSLCGTVNVTAAVGDEEVDIDLQGDMGIVS